MKRRLNRRLLLALLGATAVTTLGVHWLHAAQVGRSVKALLAQARRAEERRDLARASDYLARYLSQRPGDAAVLLNYGRVLEARAATLKEDRGEAGKVRHQALKAYEAALRVDPQNREVRRRVVDLAMQLGTFLTAELQLELLGAEDSGDGELIFLLGRCREESGRFDGPKGAVALFEKARGRRPTSIVECHTRLANLLRTRLNQAERADRVMDAREVKDGLIAVTGGSAAAYLARARYRERFPRPGVIEDHEVAKDVARALERGPNDADVLLAAAESADRAGRHDQALDHLKHGVEKHPEAVPLHQALAYSWLRAGRPDEAIKVLRRGLELLPNQPDLSWALAEVLVQVGQTKDAVKLIEDLSDRGLPRELRQYLDGRILMTRREWGQAAALLENAQATLAARHETPPLAKRSLLLLAQCYEKLEAFDQSYVAYRAAVAIDLDPDPDWVAARMGLAATLVELNRLDEAIQEYQVVLPREPAAGLPLARLLIVRNSRRPASEQDWPGVDQVLGVVERAVPSAPELAILRAEALTARGELAAARGLLDKAVENAPAQAGLKIALAGLSRREGRPQEALAILEDARKRLGDPVEIRLALAAYWVTVGGAEGLNALEGLGQNIGHYRVEDQVRLGRALAAACARSGDAQRAEGFWRQVAERQPDDPGVWIALFDLALRGNDEKAEKTAVAALDRIRKIEGTGGTLTSFGEACLLIRRAQQSPADPSMLSKARELLLQAAARRPDWSRVPLALARLEERMGHPERALEHYRRAILELGERDQATLARAAWLAIERGRYDQASLLLRTLKEERVSLTPDLQRLAAQVSFRVQDYGLALEQAQKVVSDQSNNVNDLIWLGLLRWSAGQPAEPTYRRAVKLGGDVPRAWLALVMYLVGTGQMDKARAVIDEAERALPKDRADLALAQCQELVGRADRAEASYRAALAAKPDDLPTLRAVATFFLLRGRLADAKPLLERAMTLKEPGSESAAWARRTLARVEALGGNSRQGLKALEILGLADGGVAGQPPARDASLEDLRAKAQILALQPSRARRREAIAILEDLVGRKPAAAQDLFLLAQLHEADGDWPKARDRFRQLLDARGDDLRYRAHYIRALLRHGRAEEAQVHFAKLEQLAPNQPATIESKARVLVGRGQRAAAVDLLRKFAQSHEARRVAVARLLEELGEPAAAEQMLREHVARNQAQHPQAILTLATFLGRQGRAPEALDLLDDRAWRDLPIEAVANASVLIHYGSPRADEPAQRLRRRLEAAVQAHPDKISLQFDLANLHALCGRNAEAEAILRQLHQRHPALSAPLNNLALLLALQGQRTSEASSHIRAAIELEGETPDLLDTRAIVHLAGDRTDLAIRDLEEAIAVSPTSDKYFHLAQAYSKMGRQDEARQVFDKAVVQGLTLEGIHPLERQAFQRLKHEYAQR